MHRLIKMRFILFVLIILCCIKTAINRKIRVCSCSDDSLCSKNGRKFSREVIYHKILMFILVKCFSCAV